MEKEIYLEEPRQPLSMNPKKFGVWLLIVSIVMLFVALTSAYIVKQADGNWLTVKLPHIFILNSVIIVLSSITMQWAFIAAKRDELLKIKIAISLTAILGFMFIAGQYYSWSRLVEDNVYFVSNYASGSFIYIFTGLHAVHLVSAIIVLMFTLVSTFRFRVHSKNLLGIEMCATYWHFLGGLWLYLYFFLLLNS